MDIQKLIEQNRGHIEICKKFGFYTTCDIGLLVGLELPYSVDSSVLSSLIIYEVASERVRLGNFKTKEARDIWSTRYNRAKEYLEKRF